MAIDLSLSIVPRQVERLFNRAKWDVRYAGLICFVSSVLEDGELVGNPGNQTDLDFQKDVLDLKNYREYSQKDLYYDTMRGSATLDWLLGKLAEERGLHRFSDGFLRSGDDSVAKAVSELAVATQGIAVRYYDRPRLEAIFEITSGLKFSDLMRFYDYDDLYWNNIYKFAGIDSLGSLRENFEEVLALFEEAQRDENTYVLQVLD